MIYPQTQSQTLFDAVTPVAITSSTDATPIVVTATAHGFATGDRVLVFGHATNVAANGIFSVVRVTADTFQLKDEFTGASVAGSGGGAGSGGICVKAPPVLYVQDFVNISLQLDTSGSANLTLKPIISLGRGAISLVSPRYDMPNMGATQSASNPWSYVQTVILENNGQLNGSNGIVLAGSDTHSSYEVNMNLAKYFTVIPTAWTAGAITLKAILSTI